MSRDFVVVGAGSAGAALAARLAEVSDRSVLLLEAGPDYVSRSETPDLLDSRNLGGMQHDWNLSAIPMPGRTIPYRRGKVTGGTSAVNASATQWARPADFASWVERGNPEWGWEQVRPYFRKLESDPDGRDDSHGRSGPIRITRYSYREFIPIQRAFYDACREQGFADVPDHNEVGASGVGPWPMNREGTTRVSTALGYLEAARIRPNFAVQSGSMVNRLRFDGKRAIGIELADGGLIRGRNVILCAGAVGSPAILLRSGIGPANQLRELGIEVLVDMPGVGARLWDHAAVPVFLRPKPGQCIPGRDPRFQVVATLTAEGSSEPDDLQMVMTTHLDISGSPALRAAAGVPVVAVLRAALMVPRSHGCLCLASADPKVAPRIELNYGADPEDMRRLMVATRLAWSLAHVDVLKRETEGVVGLTEEIIHSSDLLRAYILENIGTYCHALGTAPMGPEGDAGAVVDQHCRVRGTENVWIVDASVIPSVPRAVPNLTVIMLPSGSRSGCSLVRRRECFP